MDDLQTQPQAQPQAAPQQPMIYQMIQDPDFGKLAPSEQRKALSAHDPMFAKAGDADILKFVSAHRSAPQPQQNDNIDFYRNPRTPADIAAAQKAQAGVGNYLFSNLGPKAAISPKKKVDVPFNPVDMIQNIATNKPAYTPEQTQEMKERANRAYQSSVLAYGLRSEHNPYVGERGPSGEVEKLLGSPEQLFDEGTRARGAAKTVGDFATVTNANIAGTLAATGGFLGPIAPLTTRVLSTLAGAGFTAQMGVGLYRSNEEYKKAVDSGDLDKAREIQGSMMAQGALTTLAAYGTYKAGVTPTASYKGTPKQGGLSSIPNVRNTLPKHHEAMASLLDTNAGKVDPYETSQLATPVMRNEAAKAGISENDFKGREGGKLGYQLADKGIESHQGEIDSISQPFMKSKVDLSPIADAIRSEITDEMRNNAPEQAARIEKEASNFDRNGTIEELNDFRKRSNKEQQSYYRGNQTKQIMSEADIAASVKGANAARELQQNSIGNRAGVDPAYLKKLFDEEGAMIEARNALNKEYNNASKTQATAKSQTWREALIGTKGKTSIQDAKSQLLKGTFGMKPMDALNSRLKRAFSDLGTPQQYVHPPAPGGAPPVGPNRPMLTQGTPPATPLGPSSLAPQRLLGTGEPSGDITLHQPPIDAPTQMRDAAVSNISGRDKATGRFNRAFTTSPKTPFDERPIYQYPGVLQRPVTGPKPETISQNRFNAIMQDIQNAAAKRQSPQEPIPVKDSVFKHIKDAQKAQGEVIPPDAIHDPYSPHFESDDPYYFGNPNNTDPTKGFVSNIKENANQRTIEGTIIPKGQKVLQENTEDNTIPSSGMNTGPLPERFKPIMMDEKRVQYPDFRKALQEKKPSELEKSVYFDKVSGMPNAEAFNVAETQSGKAKAYARSDADGLKLFNDTYGYAAGNELLKAKAEALKEAGLEAYHEKGDEFIYRGNSEGELRIKLENARRILRDRTFEVTDQQTGQVYHLKNLDFSIGTGGTLDAAETALHAHKTAREAAGERGRGKLGSIIKTDQGTPNISEGTPSK